MPPALRPSLLVLPLLVLLAFASMTAGAHLAAAGAEIEILSIEHDPSGEVTVVASIAGSIDSTALEVLIDGQPYAAQRSELPVTGPGTVLIAIETSSSMPGAPIAAAQAGARTIIDALPADTAVAIVTFGDDATLALTPTTDRAAAWAAVDGLQFGVGSALYDAVDLAARTIAAAGGSGEIHIFTHGWQFGAASAISSSQSLDAIASSGAATHVAVLGASGDAPYLTAIARSTGGTLQGIAPAGGVPIAPVEPPDRQISLVVPTLPLALGTHDLTVRDAAGAAEALRAFEVTNAGFLSLTELPPAASDGAMLVQVAALATDGLAFVATSGGQPLPPVAAEGTISLDPWSFEPGPLAVTVTAFAQTAEIATRSIMIQIPELMPALAVERVVAEDGNGDALAVRFQSQPGSTHEIVVVVGGDEVVRTAEAEFAITVPPGETIAVSVFDASGSTIALWSYQGAATGGLSGGASAGGSGASWFSARVAGLLLITLVAGGAAGYAMHRMRSRREELANVVAAAVTTADLESALINGELAVFFQPVFGPGRALAGVEALARWDHPQLGTLPASRFVSKADSLEMVSALDAFVLGAAAAFTRELQDLGVDTPRLTLNSSPHQMLHGDFLTRLDETLREAKLAPAQVEFKLSDRSVSASLEQARAAIRGVTDVGATVCIDDFWTSALWESELASLGAAAVKIDLRSYAWNTDAHAQLVEAVALARAAGLSVAAKRVETDEEMKLFQELGCDYVQGYAFGQPMPAAQFRSWLADLRAAEQPAA